jgi:hypothetical protein
VILYTVRIGRTLYTTVAWINAFINALNASRRPFPDRSQAEAVPPSV